jgi:hypothetical protein
MKVHFNHQNMDIECTCRNYLRVGYLCRHCFWVLRNFQIEEIPKKYILRRWMKNIIPPELRSRRNRYGDENIPVIKLLNEATSVIEDCLQQIGPDERKLQDFVEKLKALKIDVEVGNPKTPTKNKNDVISSITGYSKPDKNDIQNPPVLKYKGCASDYRFKSGKEIGIEQSNKRKVVCSKCGGNNHNSRTCEKQSKKQKEGHCTDTDQEA